MGFWQINAEVYRLRPDPDNPNKELVHPPLFRPSTLLFGNTDVLDKNMKQDNQDNGPEDQSAPAADKATSTQALQLHAGRFGGQFGMISNSIASRTAIDLAILGLSGASIHMVTGRPHFLASKGYLAALVGVMWAGGTLAMLRPATEKRLH